jgi:uncharacterized protein YndB with AHSA1/START domain
MTGDLTCELTVTIAAPPERVLAAFTNPADLAVWWQVVRSVTVPRPLGTYAVEWATSAHEDDILGPLGGTFHGTVMEYRPAAELFVADAYWQPPAGDALGPMALEIRCRAEGAGAATLLTVRQSAEQSGERWTRYFALVGSDWQQALAALQQYLAGTLPMSPSRESRESVDDPNP